MAFAKDKYVTYDDARFIFKERRESCKKDTK